MPRKIKITERKLGREKAVGQVHFDSGLIEIDPRQNNKEWLTTLVHEAVHLAFPKATEKEVLKAERTITRVLWKAGVRRTYS